MAVAEVLQAEKSILFLLVQAVEELRCSIERGEHCRMTDIVCLYEQVTGIISRLLLQLFLIQAILATGVSGMSFTASRRPSPAYTSTTSPAAVALCRQAKCQQQCDLVDGKVACSCSDERFYLSTDKKHCCKRELPLIINSELPKRIFTICFHLFTVPRRCWGNTKNRVYTCGDGASCALVFESRLGAFVPKCYCTRNGMYSTDHYILDETTRSCSSRLTLSLSCIPVNYVIIYFRS